MDRIGTAEDDVLNTWTRPKALWNLAERHHVSVASALKDTTGDSENSSGPFSSEDHARVEAKLKFVLRSEKACFEELQQLRNLVRYYGRNAPGPMDKVAFRLKGLYIALLDEGDDCRERAHDLVEKFDRLKMHEDLSTFDTLDRDSWKTVVNPPLSHPKYHESILADGIHQISKLTATSESRLVVIRNLPTDISASQIVKGVRGLGGLLSIGMFPHARALAGGKNIVALQFRFASTAARYAKMIRENPVSYLDAKGEEHRADFQLVKTSSFPARYTSCPITGRHLPHDGPSGRCLQFPYFPQGCVWDFINRIGLARVVNVSYMELDNVNKCGLLTIELSSIFDARLLCRKVKEGSFDYYSVGAENGGDRWIRLSYCDSDHPEGLLEATNGHCIPHTPVNHLALKWDDEPWNSTRGMSSTWEVLQPGLETFRDSTSCVSMHYMGCLYYIQGREVRKQHRRNEDGSVNLAQDDIDTLMSATLHKPTWGAFWDMYFNANKRINLRKCDEYAAIANHRRRKAEEQGLEDWEIPCCCCDTCNINLAPVAASVQEYLAHRKPLIYHPRNRDVDDHYVEALGSSMPPNVPSHFQWFGRRSGTRDLQPLH